MLLLLSVDIYIYILYIAKIDRERERDESMEELSHQVGSNPGQEGRRESMMEGKGSLRPLGSGKVRYTRLCRRICVYVFTKRLHHPNGLHRPLANRNSSESNPQTAKTQLPDE